MEQSTKVHCSRRSALARLFAVATPLAAAWTLPVSSAHAHGDQHPAKKAALEQRQMEWGIAGEARNARRRIEVSMADHMRFTPDRIDVRFGETVRFVVRNRGKLMHEFVIGTKAENAKHAELMLKFPDMEHDEPYMAHVPPGKRGEIVWTFNREGEFEFACLIAGHYQAGMVGTIRVTRQGRA